MFLYKIIPQARSPPFSIHQPQLKNDEMEISKWTSL
jgi:hypothetical protein